METLAIPAPGTVGFNRIAANALLAGRRVLVLDDVWTLALNGFSPNDPDRVEREFPELQRLVDDLETAIRDAAAAGRELRFLLDEAVSDDQFEKAVTEVSSRDPVFSALSDSLLTDDFEGDWKLRGAVIAACDYFREEAPAEIDQLQAKLARLAAGEFQTGDIRFSSRCALYLLCAGAGLTVVAGAVVATGGAALAVAAVPVEVGRDLLGWKDSDCGKAFRDITRRRRE